MLFCQILAGRRSSTLYSKKRAAYYSFHSALSKKYFGKLFLIIFISTWNNLARYCIFADSLLIVRCTGRSTKRATHDPFGERFKTTTLEKSYWQILSVLGKIDLSIGFLWKFCWLKVMYRLLYQRTCTLLIS